MIYNACIIARVSSPFQAEAISPEEQLKNSRASLSKISRQLGIELAEVAPPIVVVQSTDILDPIEALSELRRMSPEYDHLCRQVQAGSIHFVIGRDISRVLGRTEQIQTQFGGFLRVHGVQVYYYHDHCTIVHPQQLDPRRRQSMTERVVQAAQAGAAEDEITRLVYRRRIGMEAHTEAGRWRFPYPPAGFARDVIGELPNGRLVYSDIYVNHDPTRGTTKAQLIAAARDFVEGKSSDEINPSTYRAILAPASIGVVMFNKTRREVRADKRGVMRSLQTSNLTPARAADIAEAFIEGHDIRTADEIAARLMVSWLHALSPDGILQRVAIFSTAKEIELWKAVQQARRHRRNISGFKIHAHPLTGLLVCGHCGRDMRIALRRFHARRGLIISSYRCMGYISTFGKEKLCFPNTSHEPDLLEEVAEGLQVLANNHDLLHFALNEEAPATETDKWVQRKQKAENALRNLEQERLIMLESETPLDKGEWQAWRTQRQRYQAQLEDANHRITLATTQTTTRTDHAAAIIDLAATMHDLMQTDPRRLSALFQRYIKQIVVKDKHVIQIKLV